MPPQFDVLSDNAPLYHEVALECSTLLCGDDNGGGNSSSSSSKPRPSSLQPRTIRFAAEEEMEKIREIPARSEVPLEERQALWLTRWDLQLMGERLRVDLMRASMRHSHGAGSEDSSNLWRGLEWKTTNGALLRAAKHRKGVAVVLEEQRKQRRNQARLQISGLDEARIAQLYQAAIGDCQILARQMAIQDEKEAGHERIPPFSNTTKDVLPKNAPSGSLLHQ